MARPRGGELSSLRGRREGARRRASARILPTVLLAGNARAIRDGRFDAVGGELLMRGTGLLPLVPGPSPSPAVYVGGGMV